MSASPAFRSLRAAVFAAVCVLLAAAGHGLATGDTPPPWADGAGFLAVFAAGWLLGARERALPGIGAAMLATQAGLHVAFDAARSRTAARTMPAMPMTSAHGMRAHGMRAHGMRAHGMHAHGMHAHGMQANGMHLHAHAVTAMTPHATAVHVLAALAASWWLRRGEAALWSLLRRAVALLPGLAAWWRGTPVPPPVPSVRPAAPAPVPLRQLLLRHAVSRRGPPAPIPYAI
ncbi:hypothetical protein [Streptomyces sp. Root1310]|uniref:hypothetical protein n=1 Tax=Streptomyces sp. Root1310 TaxID=1736452 RepID=UPI000708F05E|nr:hypothetical protein [Streptomyces sp. Root1310]KQX78481.1 hypothetical protein ASD48_34740 [Streptomyces sp. Root1310]